MGDEGESDSPPETPFTVDLLYWRDPWSQSQVDFDKSPAWITSGKLENSAYNTLTGIYKSQQVGNSLEDAIDHFRKPIPDTIWKKLQLQIVPVTVVQYDRVEGMTKTFYIQKTRENVPTVGKRITMPIHFHLKDIVETIPETPSDTGDEPSRETKRAKNSSAGGAPQ